MKEPQITQKREDPSLFPAPFLNNQHDLKIDQMFANVDREPIMGFRAKFSWLAIAQ
jgi:hypothetical protein